MGRTTLRLRDFVPPSCSLDHSAAANSTEMLDPIPGTWSPGNDPADPGQSKKSYHTSSPPCSLSSLPGAKVLDKAKAKVACAYCCYSPQQIIRMVYLRRGGREQCCLAIVGDAGPHHQLVVLRRTASYPPAHTAPRCPRRPPSPRPTLHSFYRQGRGTPHRSTATSSNT